MSAGAMNGFDLIGFDGRPAERRPASRVRHAAAFLTGAAGLIGYR